MRQNLEREGVLDALGMALEQRTPAVGLLAHSDRGSQYASADHGSCWPSTGSAAA